VAWTATSSEQPLRGVKISGAFFGWLAVMGWNPVMHMKRLALALLLGCAAQAALAQQQIATFTGTVVADACTVSVNGTGNEDGTVAFEPVLSNNYLRSGNTYAGETVFTLELSDCGLTGGIMRAHFYNSEPDAVTSGRLNKTDPTGTGSGWSIQLLSSDDKILLFYTTSVVMPQGSDPGGVLDATGSTSITYKARYYRASTQTPIVPGTLRGHATYVLYYN